MVGTPISWLSGSPIRQRAIDPFVEEDPPSSHRHVRFQRVPVSVQAEQLREILPGHYADGVADDVARVDHDAAAPDREMQLPGAQVQPSDRRHAAAYTGKDRFPSLRGGRAVSRRSREYEVAHSPTRKGDSVDEAAAPALRSVA